MYETLLTKMLQKGIEKKEEWRRNSAPKTAKQLQSVQKNTVFSIDPNTPGLPNTNNPVVKTYIENKHKVTKGYFDGLKASTNATDKMNLIKPSNAGLTIPLLSTTENIDNITTAVPLIPPSNKVISNVQYPGVSIQFGDYEWDCSRGALYYRKSSDKRTEIANFAVVIQRIVEVRDNPESSGETQYHIVINHAQGYLERTLLESRYKPDLTKVGETINPILNIVHKGLFDRYLSDVVAQYWIQGGRKSLELSVHGWIYSYATHTYQYAFNNTYVQMQSGTALVINGIEKASSSGMTSTFLDSYLRISKNVNLLLTALLYTLQTHIALPYKKITGQRLQSAMVFQGETQHGKSVLAHLLSRGLQSKCHDDYFYKFDGTNASISHILGRHGQGLYVFDDIYRKAQTDDSKSDVEKLNTIARILGDGIIASKMKRFGNGLEETQPFDGGVIITAELSPVENESTQGRLIINKFDSTALIDFDNNQALTFLQNSPDLFDAFLSDWIAYMELQFQHSQVDLKERHQRLYQTLQKQKLHTRLCAYGAMALNTLYFFVQFCETIGISIDFTSAKQHILNILQTQHLEYRRHSDADALRELIADAINCDHLPIADNKEGYSRSMSGYIDNDGHYCIIISRLEDFLAHNGYNKNDRIAMYEKLFNQGLLDSTSRTSHRMSCGNQRPYYFRFAPAIMENIEDRNPIQLTVDNTFFEMKGHN